MTWDEFERLADYSKKPISSKFNYRVWIDYDEFLGSHIWSERKTNYYNDNKRNYKCVKCGNRKKLHLHHKTYSYPWGLEPNWVFCYLDGPCHEKEHQPKPQPIRTPAFDHVAFLKEYEPTPAPELDFTVNPEFLAEVDMFDLNDYL